MTDLTRLSNELRVLIEFVNQRAHDANKEQLSPEHFRMVSPPYERELIAVRHIIKLAQKIYGQ